MSLPSTLWSDNIIKIHVTDLRSLRRKFFLELQSLS